MKHTVTLQMTEEESIMLALLVDFAVSTMKAVKERTPENLDSAKCAAILVHTTPYPDAGDSVTRNAVALANEVLRARQLCLGHS